MKKIVINSCYGGFGLSPLAIKRLAELEGKKCYFFINDLKDNKYIPIGTKDIGNTLFFSSFTVPNPDEVLKHEDWHKMTDKEHKNYGACAKLEIVEIPDGVDWQIDEYDGNEWVAETHRRWPC